MTTNETVWQELGQAQARAEFLKNRLLEIENVTDDEIVKSICVNALAVLAETEAPKAVNDGVSH